MAGETVVCIVGNLVADPDLRFTPSGDAVSNFTVASTPRLFKDGEWRDGEPIFMRCNVWRTAAENVAESLTKGDRVIVQGRLRQRSYENREGQKVTVMELEVDEVGPSLKFAQASVQRASRGDSAPRRSFGRAEDPWATPAGPVPASQGSGWGGEEPPF
jgi:single-strand DNA-binding protein